YFVPVNYGQNITTPAYFLAALVVEILIGYTIGFIAYLVLATIQLAGQIMDMQMGFAIVNVVDPQSGTQIPLMGNFTQIFALLIYLVINGHHYLIQALVQSFRIIPVLGLSLNHDFFDLLLEMSIKMFVIAVKISAPVLVSVLISDIAMGFIARTVPQMNVFIVGMPLKILLGFVTLFIMLPVYLWLFGSLFNEFFAYVDKMIMIMGS
ncbi:MAG: flagellar biosynthetic protein FliR, partial [Syntrophomonadaceae bacterium]|nr:flagellar biosynthetic protein FliR [Syntrophomonadaceae bacterium]